MSTPEQVKRLRVKREVLDNLAIVVDVNGQGFQYRPDQLPENVKLGDTVTMEECLSTSRVFPDPKSANVVGDNSALIAAIERLTARVVELESMIIDDDDDEPVMPAAPKPPVSEKK